MQSGVSPFRKDVCLRQTSSKKRRGRLRRPRLFAKTISGKACGRAFRPLSKGGTPWFGELESQMGNSSHHALAAC